MSSGRLASVGRLPRVGIRGEQIVDEGDDVLFLHVWFEHVFAEFLKQLCADGLVRDDQVQVGEELFERVRVIAERVHDVVPSCGVGVTRGGGYFRDGFRFEHVGCGQWHAAHVHHVEDAVRAGEVVGGDDDEGDAVDQV